MSPFRTEDEMLIGSIFSDETPLFRTPAEPEAGDDVTVRLRIRKDVYVQVTLLVGYPTKIIGMRKRRSDESFDWYEAVIHLEDASPVFYSFLIERDGSFIHYWKTGYILTDSVPFPDPAHAFRIQPGFHVPEWAKGAVQYQIFTDRFRNGNPDNDVRDREYFYIGDYVRHAASWDELPRPGDFRTPSSFPPPVTNTTRRITRTWIRISPPLSGMWSIRWKRASIKMRTPNSIFCARPTRTT